MSHKLVFLKAFGPIRLSFMYLTLLGNFSWWIN